MLAAILLPAGVFAMIVLVTAVACIVVCKRKRKKKEVMEVDDNPVYQEYELDENYERKYSINEVVDHNVYYE